LLRACHDRMSGLELSIAGWELEESSCNANAVTATYLRRPGTSMKDFAVGAKALKDAGKIHSFSVLADKGSVRLMQAELKPRGEEQLSKYGPWSTEWISYFQDLSVTDSLGLKSNLQLRPHPEPK